MENRSPYLWDYKITEKEFLAILAGELKIGRLDQDWAVVRILEYAHYPEIIQLLGYKRIIEGWHRWRDRIRSPERKRGLEFLTQWLPEHHPELLSQ